MVDLLRICHQAMEDNIHDNARCKVDGDVIRAGDVGWEFRKGL